eukprot:GHVT01045054.1.p1 GENE.GHVT01045054.1~~GHVT01045054.1.p1  ORF type:complete len:212 (-),score=54.71 GHVT01045054.1:326-961(-)
MYQSVAASVVADVGRCLGLPLVQRTITGTPIQTQSLEYDQAVKGDEVEDLYLLLQDVLARFPAVRGVCSGAIHSNYQRKRVENVCSRLGLVSVAPLWGSSQQSLFSEMKAAGMEAIIVKTASMGLNRRHLGKSLWEFEDEFAQLASSFGFHVCGEGGEFETLALDSPMHKKKLVIDGWECVEHSSGDIAPVLLLNPTAWHTEAKVPTPEAP